MRSSHSRTEVESNQAAHDISTPKEFEEWAKQNTAHLENLFEEQMKAWEYIGSDEHYKDINQELLALTHEPIAPPWDD